MVRRDLVIFGIKLSGVKRLRLGLSVGFFFLLTLSQAQTIQILDGQTKQGVAYATLGSKDYAVILSTDEKGKVEIDQLAAYDTIEVRSVGYQSLLLSLDEIRKSGKSIIYLQAAPLDMSAVVISATRWSQRRQDIPGRISSITPQEVAIQNPQTAADLLNIGGEVFIQKSQLGGGSPMVRGFSANRLLYTVDGVRMNTAVFRSGNLHNVISIDPLSVAGTEVFFGPGSIVYGSDAIGAVMAFETLKPEFSDGNGLLVKGNNLLRFSSANEEFTGHLDFQIGGNKLSFLTSVSGSFFNDLKMGQIGPAEYLRHSHVIRANGEDVIVPIADPRIQVSTAYDQINLMQKMRLQLNNYWELEYGFHYSNTTNIPRYDRLTRTRNGQPRSAEWFYGPQKWQMNNLQLSHKKQSRFFDELSIRLAHQLFEESRIVRDFNDPIRYTQEERVDAFSLNFDFNWQIGEGKQLFYGFEGIFNQVQSQAQQFNIDDEQMGPSASRYPQSDWFSYALYGTYQQRLNEQWLLQGGLRYTQFGLRSDFRSNADFFPLPTLQASLDQGAFNANLGAVFQASDQTSINLNFSNGFRAPNVDDIGKVFDSEPGAVVVPNPDLDAETAYNAELGVTQMIQSKLRLNTSIYYTYLKNAMVRRDFQINGRDSIEYNGFLSQVQAIQNATNAYVYGFQFSAEYSISAALKTIMHFNFQRGEEETEDRQRSASRHIAPMFGDWRLTYQKNGLELQVNTFFNGAIPFDRLPVSERNKDHIYAIDEQGRPYAPAWYTLNLKAQYQINQQFAVQVGLENITNQRYRPYSSGIAGAGRNLILSFRASF
ncbi:MAG: TonB-dependent receptor [Saprospiraceae bacterium]